MDSRSTFLRHERGAMEGRRLDGERYDLEMSVDHLEVRDRQIRPYSQETGSNAITFVKLFEGRPRKAPKG